MSLEGPNIIKIGGGLGQQAPSDRNVGSLILANGYAVATTFPLGATKELNSIDDAAALGLSAATDANAATATTACAWYHIDEFFRVNPDGRLFVHNGNDVPVADIFAVDGPADALLAASDNSVRYMGLVFGFDPSDTLVNTSGFAADVLIAAAAAQVWISARAAVNIYIDAIVIEGVDASLTPIDLKALDAPQVIIATACDHGYMAQFGDPAFLSTAAVGTVLGSIGVRMLSESIASVVLERYPSTARGQANYSLVDTRKNRWLKVGLSSGELVVDVPDARLKLMKKNAYCFADRFIGYQGIYFNSEATCTLVTDDFNTVHANRVWNESARGIRRALIPRMSSRIRISPSGPIDPATIADWDAACKRELEVLLKEDEIADFTFTMDPNQDVIAQGKVRCRLRVVPQGIAKAIEAEIGFLNPSQA